MQIFIKGLDGKFLTIDIAPEDTILTLKHRIEDKTALLGQTDAIVVDVVRSPSRTTPWLDAIVVATLEFLPIDEVVALKPIAKQWRAAARMALTRGRWGPIFRVFKALEQPFYVIDPAVFREAWALDRILLLKELTEAHKPLDAFLALLTTVEPSDTHAARLRVVEASATAPDMVLLKANSRGKSYRTSTIYRLWLSCINEAQPVLILPVFP